MEGGTFTLADGTISGNTALYGGEVYVSNYGTGQTFTKTGGIVYGDSPANTTHTPGSTANTATDTTPANIGKNGHAVLLYRYSGTPSGYFYRNETLGTGDSISTADTLPGTSGDTVGKWTKR